MEKTLQCRMFLILVILLLSVSAAAPTSVSDEEVLGSPKWVSLEAKKACPVKFEFLNYTIIISQCKPPKYPPKQCCGALKEFACPYAAELNDSSNDCASTMFSYINLYGKYPPGLFSSKCREKNGLQCPPTAPPESSPPLVSWNI